MVLLQAVDVPDDFNRWDHTYTTQYARWNGMVTRNPVLQSIINIRSASIFSSWKTYGEQATEAAEDLDAWEGRGNETFKQIMANLYRIAYICGDAYAEWIWEGDEIVDCEILSPDSIRQVIEKGKIVRFEETTGSAKWKPEDIFHLTYMKRGAMTHGISMIESMNNILIDREQMIQQGSEIYRLFTKPMQIVMATTDNKAKLDELESQFRKSDETFSKTVIMPKGLVESFQAIQLSIPLQPADWIKVLNAEVFMATQTPEIVLGTGYSTSEEDAKTRIAGFRGSIRFDQKWIEDIMRKQYFEQNYDDPIPNIQFSYATEAQDERYNRIVETVSAMQGWNLPPQLLGPLMGTQLAIAGILED